MGITNNAVWGIVIGLALMLVGGLVLWSYGARTNRTLAASLMVSGPEAEATRLFHAKLVRWFLLYGVATVALGLVIFVFSGFSL